MKRTSLTNRDELTSASEILREVIFQATRATRGETLFHGILVDYDFLERLRFETGADNGGCSFEYDFRENTFRGLKIYRSREVDFPRVLI